jgi:hypothetical protein
MPQELCMTDPVNEGKPSSLIAKISIIQGKIGGAVTTDEVNPFHQSRYLSLAKLMKELTPYTSAEGIAVLHDLELLNDGKMLNVITKLVTVDGEELKIGIPLPITKTDPQSIGGLIAYGRRYGVSALLGIAQEDDDGESCMDRSKTQSRPTDKPAASKSNQTNNPANTQSKATINYIDAARVKKFIDQLANATKENIHMADDYINARKAQILPEDVKRMTDACQKRRQELEQQAQA